MESIYQKLFEAEQNNVTVALATIVKTEGSTPRKAGAKMLIFSNKETFGTIGGGKLESQVINDAIATLKDTKPKLFHHQLEKDHKMGCGGCVDVFIEPVHGKYNLFIFGAGHLGSTLADMANKLGFNITLIDCREEIMAKVNCAHFNCLCTPYDKVVDNLSFDEKTFITIMTHTHDYDQLLTAACAMHKFAYLGMIGSKSKIAKFKRYYTDNKILTEEKMQKIDWPMGVPIACQTPEEIAVSILAKLIDVRGKIAQD